jgi:HD-GYP domain-containing protein (c-di-GMP phosphodiesterase class II)
MSEEKFFHIKKELLGTRKIFPFQIFIYDQKTKSHTSFQNANSPLTRNNIKKLDELLLLGHAIAISSNQKITFQRTLNLHKDDPIFNNPVSNIKLGFKSELINRTAMRINKTTTPKMVNTIFSQAEVESALQNENYLLLIEQASKELSQFSVTDSQTTSLCVHLANKFLNKDTSLNRVVAIGYFFAKTLNINDETRLASLVCAGFFSQIGMMSMALGISRISENELSKKQKDTYKKYPSYSLHLCKKAQIDVAPAFENILLDQQERISGNGFPNGKHGQDVSESSLVIGFAAYITEHNDKGLALLDFIHQNHHFLLLEFGDKVVNNFLEMLDTSTFKKAA